MSSSDLPYIILGTRPDIIKLSPIISLFKKKEIKFKIVHTNQHYSDDMDSYFTKFFKIKINSRIKFKNNLDERKKLFNIYKNILSLFKKNKPKFVIVYGDTNSALAATYAAKKIQAKIVHVEAGIRSFNLEMDEELNRIIIDNLSDIRFCPSNFSKKNILLESKNLKNNYVVGNTIIDVLKEIPIPQEKNEFANDGILTLHRKQLVDNFEMLYKTLKQIDIFCGKIKKQIIFPIHPRTLKNLKQNNFKFSKLKNIKLCKPLSYLDFIKTLKYSKIVFTDSGGVQEEASFFNILCITLRSDTERQETVLENFNILVDPYRINVAVLFKKYQKLVKYFFKNKRKSPYDYGNTSLNIFKILKKKNYI